MSPVDDTVVCMAGESISSPSHRPWLLDKPKDSLKQCEDMTVNTTTPRPERIVYYCEKDFRVQAENLNNICGCGWYYANTTSEMAKDMLRKSDVGTFLLRDSVDPRFLYSLSIKTPRGATSIRITYTKGKFQLDCLEKLKKILPKFDSTVALVDHYVRTSKGDSRRINVNRFLESSGKKDMPVLLTKPRVNTVSSLQHLSRQTINRSIPNSVEQDYSYHNSHIDKLDMLPKDLRTFLKSYPHLN
ncbi:suppressor of cytokine signaling 2-like [Mizuhopecten yessoensis]|uniref:suppressor of cytokine signaling 2-like n=1 Tax=Mizuhopecten yessoensis TaxID=6573 RepID=UPI000B45A6E3|nr:suppressor of cytokine signaling 2-like [Mizuhopecten yessoensis]